MRALPLAWGLSLLLAMPAVARAACPLTARSSAALLDRTTDERIQFLRATLEAQELRTRWWNWGFATLGYTLAATQFTLAATTDRDGSLGARNHRAFLLVNATRSTLAASLALLQPLWIDSSALALRPGTNEASKCAWLTHAEANLVATARAQREHRAPIKHAIVATAALASGLILGLGFDDWRLGGISAGVAVALGETQIWLQPMGAISELAHYQAGAISARAPAQTSFSVRPLGATPGLALALTF